MLNTILMFITGLILVFFGANILIKGTTRFARRLKISEFLVSVVIIGLGTSLPELMVGLFSAANGVPEYSIGNVVGANIIAVLLLIGIASLLTPIIFNYKKHKEDFIFTGVSVLLLTTFVYLGSITRLDAAVLLVLFSLYLIMKYFSFKDKIKDVKKEKITAENHSFHTSLLGISLYIISGGIILITGANFFTDNIITLSKLLGLSEGLMGILIIAPSTTLPELSVTIIGGIKKKSQIVLGNIIGSVLMNICLILGTSALIMPAVIDDFYLQNIAIWVMLYSFVLLFLSVVFLKKSTKYLGVLYLISYLIYMLYFIL